MPSLLQQAVTALSASRDAQAALIGLLALKRTGRLPELLDADNLQAELNGFASYDPDRLNRAFQNLNLEAADLVYALQLVDRISSKAHRHLAVALEQICDELAPTPTSPRRLPTREQPQPQLNPGDWILDVSCGAGVGILHVLATARRVWGVEGARSLTFVAVTSSPLRALATRVTFAATGCSEQAVVFSGQILAQPILAWSNDELQPPSFARCIGTPPDDRTVTTNELLAADYAGAMIIPARLLARRARTRRIPAAATP